MKNKTVVLSAPQDSLMGRVILEMYMNSKYDALVELAPNRNGYQYNGGQHTLSISGTVEDVMTWLALFKEAFPECWREYNAIYKSLTHKDRVILGTLKRDELRECSGMWFDPRYDDSANIKKFINRINGWK